MKRFKLLFGLLLTAVLCLGFASCSDDEEGGGDPIPSGLCGTWHGSASRASCSITFNSNKTGSMSFSTPSFGYEYEFTYKCNGNNITTTGVRARYDNSGDVEVKNDYKTFWVFHGSYLTSDLNSSITRYTK